MKEKNSISETHSTTIKDKTHQMLNTFQISLWRRRIATEFKKKLKRKFRRLKCGLRRVGRAPWTEKEKQRNIT